ncbi:lytic transglycosylase domain-containing protein [Hyalangium gracile]|uniref:lytic transglycosylase domain-containing protein n=1 Tax=Hyalangium gracile TaxID=394092 RepID=UPI001CCE58EF|nr:transglycosylase SLT domain-containing protein [Hyalangium gracile]
MNVSSLRAPQTSTFATQSVSRCAEAPTQALAQQRCGSPGLEALQADGFDAGPQRGAQMEKMLLGVVSTLAQTVNVLQQMLEANLGGQGGQAGLPGAGECCAPPDLGAAAPQSPEATATATAGSDASAAAGSDASAAPTAPAQSGSTSSAGTATPSGDAKLGAGFPPALAQFKDAIEAAAAKTGVPAAMLAAQIWQESRGNLAAVSTNGGNGLTDTGLMQVNPNTFKELQARHPELQGKDLSDPVTNILAGACYMKDMKEQFGSWDLALRAYNSGPNGVDRSNPNAIPAGTGDATYVTKVKQFWDTISTGQGTLPA